MMDKGLLSDRPLLNRYDPMIILLLLSLALTALLLMWHYGNFGVNAEIYYNGELIKTVPLKTDSLSELGEGYPNMTYMVSEGRIRVISSDCRDKVCIRSGTIRSSYKTIVCLPNRVVIKVEQIRENNDNDNDIDVIL
ncbi:MAG: NusG domain II-containing protein [Oscillospiraceae bacterium]|nr:NusG domain II-containing protein [Oscillospiraceae bacterium]